MKSLRVLSLSLMLACAASHASILPNEAAAPLAGEAASLMAAGKYQEAYNKYQAAAKADPAASIPLSGMAQVLLLASAQASGDDALKLRQQAEAYVRQALKMEPNDPYALEVLRTLNDDKPAPRHQPTAEAWKTLQEGEQLFHVGKLDEARAKYLEAARLDPQYSTAYVDAADSYYMQKKWPESEALFRKATEVEPLNGQAWRFLSDALAAQNKRAAAEEALFNGIAAQPSQIPSWNKLASLRAAAGYPLTSLNLKRKSSVTLGADGKHTINLDPAFAGEGGKSPDGAAWLMLAASEASARARNASEHLPDQPFAIELDAWRGVMKVLDELKANSGADPVDPALKTMQMLAKADQLEAALLLLQYKESWRPEFEAWKKEHPNGIRKFIDTYGLRP